MRRLLLVFFVALPLFAQSPDPNCDKTGRPPVNSKLCKHSNFFDPAQIWDLQKDERLSKYKPAGLKYDAYLPVGYDLAINGGLTSRDIVINLPYAAWINEWTMRLKAESTIEHNVHSNLGIWIEGQNDGFGPEGYVLRLRKAGCEFIDTKANKEAAEKGSDLMLSMDRDTMRDLIIADHVNEPNSFLDTLTTFINNNRIHTHGGGAAEARAFFEHFDPAPDKAIPLSMK